MAAHIQLKRWKRVEYEKLVEQGVFGPEDRIELIDGLLVVAEPQSTWHVAAVKLVELALMRIFPEGWDVRTQAPVALDDTSEPEPDIAVVRGGPRDYLIEHPRDPVLVVEVSLTSLAFDREAKSGLYARAGRPEYWIVNLVDRVLEVHREPAPASSAPYGWEYTSTVVLAPHETVTPLAAPTALIAVADLMP